MMQDYDTAHIDARLDADILANRRKNEKLIIVLLILLIFIFKGWFSYWLRFGFAIPSQYNAAPINIQSDPVQINYAPEEIRKKIFRYHSFINKNVITIIPQAHYELSGTVVAYNHNFIFTNGFFDSAALYDLGAAWGKMGDKKFYKKFFTSFSQKNEVSGSRVLWTKPKTYPAALPSEYWESHFSHSHLVPANRNIMAAMLKMKMWDRIKIEGELVDMFMNGQSSHTSMSRNDNGWYGDRGNGSCEVVYVTSIQIGRKVYK